MLKKNQFGSTPEAIIYPLLLLTVMWLVFWADHLFGLIDFYKFGVRPQEVSSLKGILFMPLIHSKNEIEHIINNSMPIVVLLGAVVYYYRAIALRVFVFSWLLTGLGVWFFAENAFSYHIGMSGVIYALAGFLFTSGVVRKYLPLQGISLFVAFVYGSMIWGIFPIEPHISWEGHLMGLLSGVLLAVVYRKRGPQSPKYYYEIEQEMGIEPPDFEGELNERIRLEKLQREELERQRELQRQAAEGNVQSDSQESAQLRPKITIHYVPKSKKGNAKDGNDR